MANTPIDAQHEALRKAAQNGKLDQVRRLLEAGVDPNVPPTSKKNGPLYLAVSRGHEEIANLLLDHGADANAKRYVRAWSWLCSQQMLLYDTPLGEAVSQQRAALVKRLLHLGADPHIAAQRWYPVSEAVFSGNAEILRMLVDAGGFDLTDPVHVKHTKIWAASATKGDPHGCLELLVGKDEDLNYLVPYASLPETLSFLRSRGADLEYEELDGGPTIMTYSRGTALLTNVSRGAEESVRWLLDQGVDPRRSSSDGISPLHELDKNAVLVARLLLQGGADIQALTPEGHTPLISYLSKSNYVDVDPDLIQLLLTAGDDVNARTREGRTPLLCYLTGTRSASFEVTRLLLQAGADAKARDVRGYTPLLALLSRHYVREHLPETVRIWELLLQSGADMNAPGAERDGQQPVTPLECIHDGWWGHEPLREYWEFRSSHGGSGR